MAGADVFAPELVSWQYHSSAVWTLRAALTLPPPGHAQAPIAVLKPDPLCLLPADLGRPITVRPTSLAGAPAHTNSPGFGVHRPGSVSLPPNLGIEPRGWAVHNRSAPPSHIHT
ncbi:hypothetical protein [Saccharopolyspora erythraea]|uniref:hypothetical protein n=1 Tax=Saccharopolyspora erythraea TaxID=1836 RepID=UPI002013861E|nr:hypothetical protein [Saccharopolyspora erythraea]